MLLMEHRVGQGGPSRQEVRELYRKSVVIATTSPHLNPEESGILLGHLEQAYQRFEAGCIAKDIAGVVTKFAERVTTGQTPGEPGAY